ncbi:MAG: glycosyltransferase family 4 protein, partial [Verrucomicrobiota bacterium]
QLPSIEHVVINRAAKRDLMERFAIKATVIPNVMNFEAPPLAPRVTDQKIRDAIGLTKEDRLFLQPTRIIPRKGIELAIELLSRLDDPRNKLVISHESGDEGHVYLASLKKLARESRVDLRLIGDRITSDETSRPKSDKTFSLSELYPLADFVTFPSLYEGFGNALLEAIYFGKPVLVNRYSVFREDIEPAGLDLVQIDGKITEEALKRVAAWLEAPPDPEKNREIAKANFGYDLLREKLLGLLPVLGS